MKSLQTFLTISVFVFGSVLLTVNLNVSVTILSPAAAEWSSTGDRNERV